MIAAAPVPTRSAARRPPPARFVLCADDFALSPGVSRGIIDLIARGRLSATGCMTVSPFWPEHAEWLRPLAEIPQAGDWGSRWLSLALRL